jgi:hypothetical protein
LCPELVEDYLILLYVLVDYYRIPIVSLELLELAKELLLVCI